MAIGDSFNQFAGTATTTRQPSSGVFEQISADVSPGSTDISTLYNGSVALSVWDPSVVTGASAANNALNLALLIGNTVYYRKTGTTDRHFIAGVQVDA